MPMYEYQCEACGLVFEARQKFSDSPLTRCEACDGPVKKMISQTAFALKGNGWYQQGYSKAAEKPACPSATKSSACSVCPKAANP